MASFTRGFGGRRDPDAVALPPGQHLTDGFPVLSAGPTHHVEVDIQPGGRADLSTAQRRDDDLDGG